MLKSDVFFAEILVAYSRLLVTVDRSVCSLCFWNICWKAIFTASLPLPTCTWPMCIWPFCFLGSSPDRGQSPKEWGDFWFVHLFGPSSHVSQAILQDFLIMCTRLHMSLCRSVSWSVGQSVQIHFAPLHFFLVFWAERRLDLSYSPAHPHTTDAIVCTALFPYQGRCPASPHENQ